MKEKNELLRYFILSSYRDSDYFLLSEYEELESIINNNEIAKYLEDIRYKYLMSIINEEEYNRIIDEYYIKLVLNKRGNNERTN